ncbi:YnbE family lipoprotein [Sphingomonas oryzagri]
MMRTVFPVLLRPVFLGGLLLGGCVSVKAPDKPIEINLNINVKQEVVVSLKQDAQDLITNNPELFPK